MKRTTGIIFRIAKETGLIMLNVLFMTATVAAVFFVYAYRHAPSIKTLTKIEVPRTTIIYDRTGEHVLYEIHGEENRKVISHEEIPDSIRIATVAVEDDDFYSHSGIDLKSILRAFKNDVQNENLSQGGSTITQQLVRNRFLSREKTLRRKLLEVILAIKLERQYSKEQILDMYLNEIPYGSNTYGIEAAAETFFGKPAQNLTLDESALLAALPKATTYYSPYGNHQKELIQRQRAILERIATLKLAGLDEVRKAGREKIAEKIIPFHEPISAPHFVFYVKEELEKKYGTRAVEEGGLRVYTTLDWNLQQLGEKLIREGAAINLSRYGSTNSALVALSPKSGEILAMVGSKNYFDETIDGQVNVTTRPRQPGSSFKPFVYARAFEEGYEPEQMLLDASTNFGPDGSGKPYIPRNYDGKSHGVVTLRQALSGSLNIPAVKMLAIVGIDDAIEMAHRLGITTLNDRPRYGLSLAIGGGEVTLLDETAGFSVFANDGKKNPPTPILKITDEAGNEMEKNYPKNIPVLSQQVARRINSILSDNEARSFIFGPNNLLHIDGKAVAAKTGTTQDFKDAWTVGYSPNIAVGVWSGNNNGIPMRAGADGSFVAAPIWNRFMSEALKSFPEEPFIAYERKMEAPQPEAISDSFKLVYIERKSGEKISADKAGKLNPSQVETRLEPDSKTSLNNSRMIDPFLNSIVAQENPKDKHND